jgi:hypothetical protein
MPSGCHEWQSTLHRDGYGKIWLNGAQIQAHRVAYRLYKGEDPGDKWVLHTCDNRKCVNPDHLFLGDAKANTLDMHSKGRNVGRTTVPMETVEQCQRMYSEGYSQQKIADHFGINQATVSKYIRRAQARLRTTS